ncbi:MULTISPECIES: cell division protein FtsL [unclassified Acinetobacter]|uniref:cell division protein FtsL n=1 Tax=unclassified Acinetobacter TaxID=196816 RepID=UPI0035BB09FC
MVLLSIITILFFSGYQVVRQVYDYRKDYREYNQLLQEKEHMNGEWGRLLIEQQTFGATGQVGTVAVTQLKMYSPPVSQTIVIAGDKVQK